MSHAARRLLRCVPGLRPVYRAARAGWQRLRRGRLTAEERRRAAAHWGQMAAVDPGDHIRRAALWLTSGQVLRSYVFSRFGGINWYEYLRQRYCPRPRRLGLSVYCGGGLLHFLLAGIMQNFDQANPEHREWLRRLYAAEQEAMDRGDLASDFSFIVARKRVAG